MQHLQKKGEGSSDFAPLAESLGGSFRARVVRPDLLNLIHSAHPSAIIKLAGEPGDRWLGHRKMAGWEESPDTVVVGSREPVTK